MFCQGLTEKTHPGPLQSSISRKFDILEGFLKYLMELNTKKMGRSFKCNSFLYALFCMLGFGQKLVLESFQLRFVEVFNGFN